MTPFTTSEDNLREEQRLMMGHLSGDITPEEEDELQSLLDNDPELAKFCAEMKATDALVRAEAFDTHSGWLALKNRIFNLKLRRLIAWSTGVAACLLICTFALFWTFSPASQPAQWYECSSTLSANTVLLPDGTTVYLGARSTIRYCEDRPAHVRNVILRGSAFFEVAHVGDSRFVVEAADNKIEVTGTCFNVDSYIPHEVVVTLTEGGVRFIGKNKENTPVTLAPGQKLVYNSRTQFLNIEDLAAAAPDDFKEGRYLFSDMTLDQILLRLNHLYGVNIICNDEQQLSRVLRLTRRNGETLSQTLEVITALTGLQPQYGDSVISLK